MDWVPGSRSDRIAKRLSQKYGGEPMLAECWILQPGEGEGPIDVVMWEAVNGMMPEGMSLQGLCENGFCCNPLHLAAVA